MAEMVKTEEILGQKWDKCVLDAGIKMSSGLAIGKLLEEMFVKRLICFTIKVNFRLTKFFFSFFFL